MTLLLKRCQQRIDQIKQELFTLGLLRPGSLSEQYNVCGKPGCRCKDPHHPKKHGPYYQLSYTHLGKSTTEFVKRDMLGEVREQLANYARFRQLTEEWVELSLSMAKLMRTGSSLGASRALAVNRRPTKRARTKAEPPERSRATQPRR